MGVKRAAGRLLLSLAGGTLLPLTLAVGGGVLSTYTESRALRVALDLPTGWPKYLYLYLFPNLHEHLIAFVRYTLLPFVIVLNVLLYALVTYACLRLLVAAGRAKPEYDLPPPPGRGGAEASR